MEKKAYENLNFNQPNTLPQTCVEQGTNLMTKRVLKRTGLAITTIHKNLEALRDKGILFTEEQPGTVRWRFEDPFFGMWIHYFIR